MFTETRKRKRVADAMQRVSTSSRVATPGIIMTLALMPFLASCDWIQDVLGFGDDAIVRGVNAIDDAIDSIADESQSWQAVLTDLSSKLTDDVQSTLRIEVQSILSRTIGQTGVEVRCNVDFLGDRVTQALRVARARFLGDPLPAVEPGLCQVVPIAIDRSAVPARITQLEYYGYDFDQQNSGLAVFLESTSGQRVNVTRHLDRPTHYAMTLRFGATGVQLSDESERFVLEWSGERISTVAVIQQPTPVCQVDLKRVRPSDVTFVPPKKGNGDRDFDGNGPNVQARITLDVRPDQLKAHVYMRAKETEEDWTRADGSKIFSLWSPDPGWQIERVSGPLETEHRYRDNDHTIDSFGMGSGGPAKRLVFVGDTEGNEAGTKTQVEVSFNELIVEVVQNDDCVSDVAVRALTQQRRISDTVIRRLEADVRNREQRRQQLQVHRQH